MEEVLPAVVLGAGQAGLATSYGLRERDIPHVVLERGRIGESWLNQRWDTFRLNTPSWSNGLPGMPFPGDPDAFETAAAFVSLLERYRQTFDLPVRTGAAVAAVDRENDGQFYVRTASGDGIRTRHLVIATGIQNKPLVPAVSADLPPALLQLHSADYRTPAALPPGAVLVVGGAQTGCQIAEDLLEAGRHVYMATSRIGRVRRRYRGQDIVHWLFDTGFFDTPPEKLPDPMMRFARQPQTSGVAGGRTVSYQQLARQGATLLGRLRGASGATLLFDQNREENIAFADRISVQLREMIDAYIEKQGIAAPAAEPDPAEAPEPSLSGPGPASLDVASAGITSLIWCTGFGGDFSWLHLPAFDDEGFARQKRGIGETEGLYFVGFPWISRRKSGIIAGVGEDATHVADVIRERCGNR